MTTETKEKKNGKATKKDIVLSTKVAEKLVSAFDAKNQAARDYQIAINWERELLGLVYDYENIAEKDVMRVEINGEVLTLTMK